jgi:hypothetical protein
MIHPAGTATDNALILTLPVPGFDMTIFLIEIIHIGSDTYKGNISKSRGTVEIWRQNQQWMS